MIKSGKTLAIINPPNGYLENISNLNQDISIIDDVEKKVDCIQVFVENHKELEETLIHLKLRLNPGGMIWVTYHKGTSRIKTNINRDIIREFALQLGLDSVAMIAIDDNWSALRLKVIA
jgi:hypothetical protein